MYGENGAKIMVYNMKRNPKKKGGQRKRKFKKYNSKRKNTRLLIILFRLSRG